MSNTNTKIFSEAIAEAKSIREAAMVNAKLALEEAFAPRMQEMMSSRLEALSEENEETEESYKMSGNDSMEEISLEELLAELEALEGDGYSEEDGSVESGLDNPYMKENQIFEEAEDDDTVGEITVDDLKEIIRDVVSGLMGGESEEEESGEEEEMADEEETEEEEDELNLEEILAELDSLNENEYLEEEELDEIGGGRATDRGTSQGKDTGDELDIKLVNALKSASAKTLAYLKANILGKAGESSATPEMRGFKESAELEEAMSTISTLRSELNEVNLLNAKLLYVNKLFKSKNLTESQKVKVINAFDRAETVKETKNIFETLKESLNAPVKSVIKESLSFASKAAGVADRKPIVENNDFIARMQKLAGII